MAIKKVIKNGIKFVLANIPSKKVFPQIVTLRENELLKGRSALITGGTSGIGYAIAKAFLHAGASVVITGREKNKLDDAVIKLQHQFAESTVHGFEMDIRSSEAINNIIDLVRQDWGGQIDILVNCAGVLGGGSFYSTTEREWDDVMNTNLKGTFFVSQVVSEYMIKNEIQGNILNIASSSSLRPATNAYTLSKWGIKGLTVGLAKKLTPYNIVVNGIAPGPTATSMMKTIANDDIALPNNPTGRFTTPEEVGQLAVILVSNIGRQIVGDIIYISGGAGVITVDDISY